MTNCAFYRSSESVPTLWDRQRSYSFTLYDGLLVDGNPYETSSLPSSPIPFLLMEDSRRPDSLWKDADSTKDFIGCLSSSASSGYCSESSEADSSSDASSVFSSFSFPRNVSLRHSEIHETCNTISGSSDLSVATGIRDSPHDGVFSDSSVEDSNRSPNDLELRCRVMPITITGLPELMMTSPLSPSAGHTESCPEGRMRMISNMTSVSVPSKRSSSVSSNSSSGELTFIEEGPRRRVKDDEGFIRRAACVCVNEDESKVVLISSKNEGGGWLVPGGGLESGEEEADAAVREAWEEAGITGRVKRCLGVFQIEDESTHKKKRTAVYVLTVNQQHSEFPEVRLGRVREWFPIDAAVHHLSQCKPHQMAYLRAL